MLMLGLPNNAWMGTQSGSIISTGDTDDHAAGDH